MLQFQLRVIIIKMSVYSPLYACSLTHAYTRALGSCIDEERSKLRYVVWIAEFSESSIASLWTQMALPVKPGAHLSERPFHWSVSLVFALVYLYLFKSLASLEVVHCPSQTAKCRRVACALTSVQGFCWEPTFVQLDLRSTQVWFSQSYVARKMFLFSLSAYSKYGNSCNM